MGIIEIGMGKTIIVSNRLPIKIERENEILAYRSSEGGLATGLGSIYKKGDNLWVGWPGMYLDDNKEKEDVIKKLRKQNMQPVFLTEQEIRDYYDGFSNETLWPNFHYFNQYAIYEESLWEAYQKVNHKFFEEILKVAEPNDTIWIHDYQLLILPRLLREQFHKISMGFFLHIPFPSYESFRLLPWRKEILNGMLGADLIGFHTYDDMRHFLSSVNRIAGISNLHGEVETNERKILVDAFPMGIDYNKYAISAAAPETLEREARYRTSLGEVKIILSIDRLDYSKGIPQRLKAFELFLEKYPEFRNNVSFFMIVVPSRDQVGKYKELKEEVDELVGRINGNYGRINWTPIHYFYRSLPLDALSAFYRMANVALVTPMRDGMNLVCKEYIASKLDKKGVLILSEMAGASKELSDAILINPNDINQLVEALYNSLTMPEEEQMQRMEIMQKSLKRYNIHHWVKLFMEELERVKSKQDALTTKILDEVSLKDLGQKFSRARKRLIFLDYDGTLVPFNGDPKMSKPDKELTEILTALTTNKKNKVVIISGRDRDTLWIWLGKYHMDFICEHGVWLKEFDQDWKTLVTLTDEWKKDINNLLELYVSRTPGSFVEEKDFSLVWHYRKVETGLGELRTRELMSHLRYKVSDSNLRVHEGDKVVEIKSSRVNKGRAALKWLDKDDYDFIMAIGDDLTDEDTFKAMPPENSYTIKVGGKTSAAMFSLRSYQEVRDLLKKLESA